MVDNTRRKILGAAGIVVAGGAVGGYLLNGDGNEGGGAGDGYSTPDAEDNAAGGSQDVSRYNPADYFNVRQQGTITSSYDQEVPLYRVDARRLDEFGGKLISGIESPFWDGKVDEQISEYARRATDIDNWMKEDEWEWWADDADLKDLPGMSTWMWPTSIPFFAFSAGIHESGNIPFIFTTWTDDENGYYTEDGETTFPGLGADWPGDDSSLDSLAFLKGIDTMAAADDPAVTYEEVGQDIYIGSLDPDKIVPEDADRFYITPSYNNPNFLGILSE